jgi:putative ABC transport system ATP-binding protein
MTVIEICDLSLDRSGLTVLHHVSLTIARGEIFMLIGPSGSGKSSLLRCINRLEEPATLDVTRLRCKIGMVFQAPAMFPGTVAENIGYGPRLCGREIGADRVNDLMTMVTLDPALAQKPASELSGGQAQRVAIARALANEPDVLLLDEPTSALDPIATRGIEETLHDLRRRLDLTLIWVTHLVEQARRAGDRALMLEAGRVVAIDSAVALFDPQSGNPRALAFANGEGSAQS